MRLSGHLVVPNPVSPHEPGTVTLRRGRVLLVGDRIGSVEFTDNLSGADLGGPDAIISTGFVDAHLHLPQFDSIGVDGLTLLDWLDAAVFPAEMHWTDIGHASEMSVRVARRLLAAGTTTVAAYATVHHAATIAAMHALNDAGLSGFVGQVLMDQPGSAPPELLRPARQLLAEAAATEPVGRIAPIITPRFALSCTPELLAGCGALAAKTGRPIQTHLAETRDESAHAINLHGGTTYTDIYARAGLLTPRTLLAHGIHLSDAERAAITASGAAIAHCPTANTFLASGQMDMARTRAAGARVALGSDIGGGYEVSMPRVARAMLDTAKVVRMNSPHPPSTTATLTAAHAWHMITAGNSDALGLRGGGRIEPGAPADLLVIQPGADMRFDLSPDPLSTLLYSWDDRWLTQTITRGIVRFDPLIP